MLCSVSKRFYLEWSEKRSWKARKVPRGVKKDETSMNVFSGNAQRQPLDNTLF